MTREPDRWSQTGFEVPRSHPSIQGAGTLGDRLRGFVARAFTLGGWGMGPGGSSVAQLLTSLRGDKEITRPYWQHPWVHSCTAKIADNAAEARIKFWRDQGEDADEVPEEDPVYELFKRPHPSLSYSKWLRNTTVWHWHWGDQVWALRQGVGREDERGQSKQDWVIDPNMLAGAKFLAALNKPKHERLQLWPLKATTVLEVKGPSGLIEGWKLNTSTGQIDVPIEATSHIFSPDPYDPEFLRGLGRISAILRIAQIDFAAEQYIESSVANGGVPNILLIGKHGLTEAQAKAAAKKVREEHQASDKNGLAMVLAGDIEAHFPGHSPKDMEWGRLRFWDRETIISVLGASPAFLGITENVQRGNAEESRKSVWQDTISPWLEILATEIQNEFLPLLPEPWRSYGVSFDTSHIKALQESEDSKIERAVKVFQAFPVSFSEAAELAGWEIPENMAGRDERHAPPPSDDTTSLRPSDPQVDPEEGERSGLVSAQAIKKLDLLALEPFRAAAAKVFRDQTMTFEERIKKTVRRVFEGYVQASIRKATDLASEGKPVTQSMGRKDLSVSDLDQLFPDIATWQTKLWDSTEVILGKLYDTHAQLMADALGAAQLSSTADFEVISLLAQKEIAVKETVVTLRTALKETLLRNLSDGPGIGTLADQLREVLESYRADLKVMQDNLGARAQLIARTETTSIANGARMNEAKAQGVQEMRWISARDANVRESHQQLDGETRPVGEAFGFGLSFPGDPSADISETANCRCTIAATSKGL